MNRIVKASLDWINSEANPQDEFSHSYDENRVKCASRTLFQREIIINEQDLQEIVDYCQKLGMPKAAIKKIANWYSRPKNLRLKYGIELSAEDLMEKWKDYL